jgi:hypothetical protein
MLFHLRTLRITGLVNRLVRQWAGSFLLGFAVLAAKGSEGQTNVLESEEAQALTTAIQPGEIIGREQVIRCRITCGTNQFLFVLPPFARCTDSNSEKIVVSAADGRYYATIRILSSARENTVADKSRARKEQALGRYPDARDLQEFSWSVAGRPGEGVELRQQTPAVGDRFVRLLWVPCAAGILEFTLNTDARSAGVGKAAFETILLTLQSNEQGRIQVIPRSDKS